MQFAWVYEDVDEKSITLKLYVWGGKMCDARAQYTANGMKCETVSSFRIANGKYIITVLNRACNTRTHTDWLKKNINGKSVEKLAAELRSAAAALS